MKTATVIGSGISGCMYAWALQQKGWDVTVIEKAPFTGVGLRTFFHAGHPFTWGPRHFLSPYPEAYNFLNDVIPLRDIKKINISFQEDVDDFFFYPPHESDISKLPEAEQIQRELNGRPDVAEGDNFEDYYIQRVGKTIYERYNKHFNMKAWSLQSNAEMDFGLAATVKRNPIETGDPHEFKDWYNCYPIEHDGYNRWFDFLLQGCKVRLNTEIVQFDIDKSELVLTDGERVKSDIIVSTISPDTLMDNQYGELRYMGRECYFMVLPIEEIFPKDTYFLYYPSPGVKQTRVVEYKKFTQHKSPNTLLVMEVPSKMNKLYPMLIQKEVDLAQKYIDALPDHIFSVGRMGTYRYIDIDDIILAGFEFKKEM